MSIYLRVCVCLASIVFLLSGGECLGQCSTQVYGLYHAGAPFGDRNSDSVVNAADIVGFFNDSKACTSNSAVDWTNGDHLVDAVRIFLDNNGLPPSDPEAIDGLTESGVNTAFKEIIAALVTIFDSETGREPDVRAYTRLLNGLSGEYFGCTTEPSSSSSVTAPSMGMGSDRDGDGELTFRDIVLAVAQKRKCMSSVSTGFATGAELLIVARDMNP